MCIIFEDSTCRWYHMVFVFLWLTSLGMIISRSIHVAANGIICFFFFFFLWLSNSPLCIYTPCAFSCFTCVWLFETPWTVARQAPLSIRFSRQEYRSGLPCPPPGALPHPGIEPVAPSSPALQADSLLLSHWGSLYTPHLFHLSMDNHASMPWLS